MKPITLLASIELTFFIFKLIKATGKTNKDHFQVNTKLFRSLLDLSHKNEDTPIVQRDEKNSMLLLCY